MKRPHSARTVRLADLLVERGLFADAETASRWVMAGKVLVDEQRVDKPGAAVPAEGAIRIKGKEIPFASRGGVKLAGALDAFGLPVGGRVALDAGASTGGFTDCLLQRGARRVYAVDVGYGQLKGALRADARVVNLERTNIADLRAEALQPRPDLATVDLSYLSLKQAIPTLLPLLQPPGDLVCLVKPLFEVEEAKARRTGRIDDPAAYQRILSGLVAWAEASGLAVLGVTHSPVRGSGGTVEFFLWLGPGGLPAAGGDGQPPERWAPQVERTVAAALCIYH